MAGDTKRDNGYFLLIEKSKLFRIEANNPKQLGKTHPPTIT